MKIGRLREGRILGRGGAGGEGENAVCEVDVE